MSLREGDQYREVLEEDRFGKRLFYDYDLATVKALVEPDFAVRCLMRVRIRDSQSPPWMFLGLQKSYVI